MRDETHAAACRIQTAECVFLPNCRVCFICNLIAFSLCLNYPPFMERRGQFFPFSNGEAKVSYLIYPLPASEGITMHATRAQSDSITIGWFITPSCCKADAFCSSASAAPAHLNTRYAPWP